MSGNHRGKGPKGYERSQERIKEEICDRLTDDDSIDASEIEVNLNQGEVTLSGSVSDKQTKRRVEDMIESMSGVKSVQNNLRISSGQEKTGSGESKSGSGSTDTTGSTTNKPASTSSSQVKGEREKAHHN